MRNEKAEAEFLFAPLEGITFPVFRKVHYEMFPGAAEYYSPFLAPDSEGSFKPPFLREKLPDSELGIPLVPQLLANDPNAFLITAKKLRDLGYDEINLNAGCPSGTVFAKYKGSGMLRDLKTFENFLDNVFNGAESLQIRISVKTRLGVQSTDEFPEILKIYNKYPITKLIIHARDRNGMYQSVPDISRFASALKSSRSPVCYNGEIFTPKDFDDLWKSVPEVNSVMVGRGAVANPALVRMLRGGNALEKEELFEFHNRLFEESISRGLSPIFAVQRMKEIWFYMIWMFPGSEKYYKAIKKARMPEDYRSAVNSLFRNAGFDGNLGFPGTRKG